MTNTLKDLASDRILEAAVHCILKDGIDAVQITQIAAAAGMSSRTLHRYYPQKETLLADAAAKYLSGVYSSFAESFEAIPKEHLNGREKLLLLLQSQRKHYQTNTIEAMLMVDLRFYRIRHGEQMLSWWIPGGDKIRDIVLRCVAEGQQDGSIRPELTPAAISGLISASYNGVMQRLTLIYRANLPEDVKTQEFNIFDEYLAMAERYLKPLL